MVVELTQLVLSVTFKLQLTDKAALGNLSQLTMPWSHTFGSTLLNPANMGMSLMFLTRNSWT